MTQRAPTVSNGRLGQVDLKMGEHVQGEKKGGEVELVARIQSRHSQTIDI